MERRIAEMDSRLSELDPVWLRFCDQRSYRFSPFTGICSRRSAWTRGDIDRVVYLSMIYSVPEFLERGFSVDMPWTLGISASLRPGDGPLRIFGEDIAVGFPFSVLEGDLPKWLEAAHKRLTCITRDDVLACDWPPPDSNKMNAHE